ncbi:MAG: sodium/glutamate symporter, partial [Verrucomicrobiales bacterium]
MKEIHLEGADVIIVAILVLGLGNYITNRVLLLKKYSIPLAVTGGLICSILVLIIDSVGGPKITFDMRLRDVLLLLFFSTIGI